MASMIWPCYVKYKQTHDFRDLEAAVEFANKALETVTHGRFHVALLDTLGLLLSDRFQRTGSLTDLEDSVKFATQALESSPLGSYERAIISNNLATVLRQRSIRTTGTDDLEKGIRLCEEALDSPFQELSLRQTLLSTLGTLLGLLFRRRSDIKDLERAIQVSVKSLRLAEHGSDARAIEYNNLGNRFRNLYKKTGNPDHLTNAIRCARQAVQSSVNEMFRASRLANLGEKLIHRYNRTMDLDDLNEAVECLKRAVESPLNRNDSDWPAFANHLAQGLSLHYARSGDKSALDESVRIQRQGMDHKTLHRNHPSRREFLCNIGARLWELYLEGGEIRELVGCIKAFREAVELGEASSDGDHSAQLVRKYNLGTACYEMYCKMGSQSSALLKEVSRNVESVTSRMLDDQPEKAASLMTSGHICMTLGDNDKALRYYILSAENHHALPIVRVHAARAGLRIYRSKNEWDKAILLASMASKLLPLVCSRYVSLRDQEHAIADISGFAADACSLFLMSGRPEEALQSLEFGRGLILGYLVDGRSDLSAMKEDAQANGLAQRYEILRDQLFQLNDADRSSGRRDKLIDEIEGCVKGIRRIPKYKRFLQEPEIEEIKSVATDCPIIIVNSTDIASHGIIIWKGKVTSLPLEQLSSEAVPTFVRKRLDRYADATRGVLYRHVGRDIYMLPDDDSDFLSWLWMSCVKIVLDKLESIGLPLNGERRVWWIGTGAAASFPFHAAGMHSCDPSECTLMKVISSYAPTIKTLRFSRLQSFENSKAGGPNTLLFVGMPTTPGGLRPLPGVLNEESVIREACGEKYECEVRRHPTTSEVLEKITESKVVHFACHGLSDPRLPSESHLLLQNQSESGPTIDRLTVERLSKVKAKERSFLAFLSACSTAEVKATSVLSDEPIHLASIFQVSGFAHTIGALWSASDQACVQVAKEFYRNLFKESGGDLSNDLVARALHSAVMKLRSTTDRPETWAPFVHFGA